MTDHSPAERQELQSAAYNAAELIFGLPGYDLIQAVFADGRYQETTDYGAPIEVESEGQPFRCTVMKLVGAETCQIELAALAGGARRTIEVGMMTEDGTIINCSDDRTVQLALDQEHTVTFASSRTINRKEADQAALPEAAGTTKALSRQEAHETGVTMYNYVQINSSEHQGYTALHMSDTGVEVEVLNPEQSTASGSHLTRRPATELESALYLMASPLLLGDIDPSLDQLLS